MAGERPGWVGLWSFRAGVAGGEWLLLCSRPEGLVRLLVWASLTAQLVKNLPAMQAILVRFLGQEDLL